MPSKRQTGKVKKHTQHYTEFHFVEENNFVDC